ncbi:hypothetical protein SODALDRAFT_329350 [Sodiomyces alkalinus F11]|uniref:Uncharacterized protein n=1 Tax=Sodiomyces alkalinus (strain CBS 110278 / VKM F-3762 / F11) TaxID=1314773 RepID=A0A3N2PKW5_SODAK|nr:hypothetical protein SODALDRAFT_329350 [Sodiomyces alkalinus F11]ROT35173.1 hypothetical protein SODALDRAFT_329350 [Sodiomyces alkalinus F11]
MMQLKLQGRRRWSITSLPSSLFPLGGQQIGCRQASGYERRTMIDWPRLIELGCLMVLPQHPRLHCRVHQFCISFPVLSLLPHFYFSVSATPASLHGSPFPAATRALSLAATTLLWLSRSISIYGVA